MEKVTKIQSIFPFQLYGQKNEHEFSFELLHRQITFPMMFLLSDGELAFVDYLIL